MKIRNGYTASLKSPSRYNPNNHTSLGCALLYIVMLTTFLGLPYLLDLVDFSQRIYEASGNDYYFLLCVNALLSQGVIVAFGLVYSAIKGVNPVCGGGYRVRFDFTHILFACMIVVGVQLCFTSLHVNFAESAESVFDLVDIPEIDESLISGNIVWAFVYLAMVAVLPAVCEEIVFRGVLMRGFARFGGFASVIISSVMFSLFHGNFQQVILQFLGGVAIGACVYVTKNFLIGCVMHFFNNLFASWYVVYELLFVDRFAGVNAVYSTVIGIVLLIAGCYYYFKLYLVEKGYQKRTLLYGKEYRALPVLMSAENRAESSSIVIDAMQIDEFKRYYPDAMRFKRGRFISLNREGKALPSIIFIGVGIALAALLVILNRFGI